MKMNKIALITATLTLALSSAVSAETFDLVVKHQGIVKSSSTSSVDVKRAMNNALDNAQLPVLNANHSISDSGEYSFITVEANSLDAAIRTLSQSESFSDVDANITVTTDKPLRLTYGYNVGENGLTDAPNDPEWREQKDYFAPLALGSNPYGEFYTGHDITGVWAMFEEAASKKTVRVGVIDGDFTKHHDINWADEGIDVYWGDIDNDPYVTDAELNDLNCGSHGNGVASVIAAYTDNGVGIAGAGVDVEIVPGRALYCGTGDLRFADAVRWMAGDTLEGAADISEPVDVINMSLGAQVDGGCTAYVQDSINYAVERGIPVIIASGNKNMDTKDYIPSGCDNVITVGANDWAGDRAEFSNYGDTLSLSAHGKEVAGYTARATEDEATVGIWEGTSFAAPLVTASVANVLSQVEDLDVNEINFLLLSTTNAYRDGSTCLTDPTQCGVGTLNAKRFLEASIAYKAGELTYIRHALADGGSCVAAVVQRQLGNAVTTCDLYEVNMNAFAEEKANVTYTMFRVATGGELVEGGSGVETFINATSKPSQLMELSGTDLTGYDYGVKTCIDGKCSDIIAVSVDATTGASCSN